MSVPNREAFYQVIAETRTDPSAPAGEASFAGSYRPTSHTAGPWSGDLQHAGPPSALLARAIGRLGGGPTNAHLARVAIEILAPVPVAPLRIEASSLRSGRKVNLCDAALFVDGSPEPVMRMR
ncbi:MAG: acyl-CoA thioesterase domain-containing protein, partial [Actinomycetes bacterium]